MNAMPYRPPNGDPRAGEIADLVRRIADNRRALLPHRAAVRDLDRIVKDPWRIGPVEIDESGLLADLPAAETVSLRLDGALAIAFPEPARCRVSRVSPERLELRRGRLVTGSVEGDPRRLDLLEHVLGGTADEHLLDTLLPKDDQAFARLAAGREAEVRRLLEEGRQLVERVERLVCAVYQVPDDLTEQVVEHAVRRSS